LDKFDGDLELDISSVYNKHQYNLEEDVPPFYVFLSMTEWSGPEFTYCSNMASNQATKPKLHGDRKFLQN